MKRSGYTSLRAGTRIIKSVRPRGGYQTHTLSGKVVSKSGDDLVVRFDDRMRVTTISQARQQYERGLIRRQGRR